MLPALLAAIPVLVWSFDDGPSGFLPSGDSNQWEWGAPATGPGPTDACWGTRLSGDYLNDATDYLEVPLPDLTGLAQPVVTLRHWYDVQTGDLGYFEVDSGTGWGPVTPIFGYPVPGGFSGSSGGWEDASIDLRLMGTSPKLRLVFASDPSVSASGWYVSDVALFDGDVTAPQISPVALPGSTEVVSSPYPVRLEILDDTAVAAADVFWRANLGPEQSVPLVSLGSGVYEALIPAQSPDSLVSWYAMADDGEQVSVYPSIGSEAFRVYLRAPTNLVTTATGRIVGDTVDLGWDPPASIHPVVSYRIDCVDAEEGPWIAFDTEVEVPLLPTGGRVFQVRAVYEVGIGDPSNAVTVEADVPDLLSVFPPVAWQGDTVRIQVRGTDFYMSQESASLGFGPGIRVDQLEVVDVERAIAMITIDLAAEPGPRSVLLSSSWGSVSFPDSFVVLDGADAPRVLSVDPPTLTQGETATVRVRASLPFAGNVLAEAGDGLVLVRDPSVEDDVVTLELVVAGDAPTGPSTVVLDDGRRLWTADLDIKERVYSGETGCGGCNTAPLGPGFAPWLLLLLLGGRIDQARRLHPDFTRRSRRNGRSVAE